MTTERRNICLTINSLDSGGAEKQCLLLAKALQPFHNTLLVILNPRPVYPPRLKVIQEEGLDHIYLSGNPILNIVQLTRLLRKRKIDIIFSFLPTDTIISAICGKAAGVTYIIGGIRNSYISSFKYAILKFVHNYISNYTISNNFSAYHAAIDYGFKDRVLVIPNGIAIRALAKKEIARPNTITIISVGRLVKQKSYETAIRSIAHLKSMLGTGYEVKYKIVGQGSEEEAILSNIEKYKVKQTTELITNPPNIYELLETADIYLCTSIFEGISNSIMEAMNCALPIIATDAGDNSKLVIHGINGFITPVRDYKQLGEHLYELVNSIDDRQRMGKASYDHLVKYYSYKTFQNYYLRFIEQIANLEIEKGKFRNND